MLKNIKLKDFQEQTLNELKPFSSIGLFFKTGAGKSYTAIVKAVRDNKSKHILVICPQKAVTQWFDYLKKITNYNVCTYEMNYLCKRKNQIINDFMKSDNYSHKAIVVNIEAFTKFDLDFVSKDWTIILDESHKIKNYYKIDHRSKTEKVLSGKNTKAILDISEKTDYKIILTATPAEKKFGGYIDYFSQLKFLGYVDMSERLFKNRYCIEVKVQRPGMPFPMYEIMGYRMHLIESELKPIINTVCRSYTPKYGDYEPEHIIIKVPKTKSYNSFVNNKVYREITCDNSSSLRVAKKTLTGGKITGTDEYKIRYDHIDNYFKSEWLEEFISNTDDVVSVLYNYNVEKDMIIDMCKKLNKKYKVIDGTVKDKSAAIKEDFEILIGQYKAVGESLDGLHLKCHIMVLYSMPESSEIYTQSIGRIDRIGQTEMPVYYHLLMMGTIDEYTQELIDNKKDFTDSDLEEWTINI